MSRSTRPSWDLHLGHVLCPRKRLALCDNTSAMWIYLSSPLAHKLIHCREQNFKSNKLQTVKSKEVRRCELSLSNTAEFKQTSKLFTWSRCPRATLAGWPRRRGAPTGRWLIGRGTADWLSVVALAAESCLPFGLLFAIGHWSPGQACRSTLQRRLRGAALHSASLILRGCFCSIMLCVLYPLLTKLHPRCLYF